MKKEGTEHHGALQGAQHENQGNIPKAGVIEHENILKKLKKKYFKWKAVLVKALWLISWTFPHPRSLSRDTEGEA